VLHNKGKQMKKYTLTTAAIALGAIAWFAAPAYAEYWAGGAAWLCCMDARE
jgi:hypothetical protein